MRHVLLFTLLACVACCRTAGSFSKEELDLIHNADSIMRVLTIEDPADLLVLRTPSSDLSGEALLSSDYDSLSRLMVATVTHPSQDGVGIAGPQVGINRRIVAVQRFDKEPVWDEGRLDHPFEVYPNIRIVWASDSLAVGPEGCLSVPDMRGEVLRSQEIVIEYADLQSLAENRMRHGTQASFRKDLADSKLNKDAVPTRCDTVRGFTAVIFQHEIDHLDGVLYIDRL
jgi:peptide deformylase